MKEPHTPLPWHLMGEGFSRTNVVPTLYATNNDLEYVCKIPKDTLLVSSVQDNIKNAEYIHQAVNNFPEAVKLLKELEDFLDYAGYSFNDTLFSNRAKEINNFLTKLEDESTK